MQEYLTVLQILDETLNGENLTDSFNSNLSDRNINRAKVKDICYGILRNYYKINSYIKQLVKNDPDDWQINLLLKIAFYEILFTKKPEHAITNDIVNLAFQLTENVANKNFVNAVLRNFIRKKDELKSGDLETKYNMPLWLINKLKYDYPHNYVAILQNLNLEPKLGLRINIRKFSQGEYVKLLEQEQIKYTLRHNKIVLDKVIAIDKIPLFNEGIVSIQDIAAQQLIDFYSFAGDNYVLDACSAPGGKACQVLENVDLELIALDINANRLQKVEQNLQRLHLKALTQAGDASDLSWWNKRHFDTIIADVPCSATGTIKRNPDIKLHRNLNDISIFINTQRAIILNLWKTLKVGGKLIYITCSVFKEENQENIRFFIEELKNVRFIKELQILPTQYNDGFYYCLLEKI